MAVIDHAVTIPSVNNAPNPSGTLTDSTQPASPDNLMSCPYPCTVAGHTDTVTLLWDGQSFSLPDSEANDVNFGSVEFTYNPPLE